MEDKIKEIISGFIKIPAHEIEAGTGIGRAAVNSSILLHRMYAKLAEQGIVVENYRDITHFGDLLQKLNGSSQTGGSMYNAVPIASMSQPFPTNDSRESAVGIDIEEVSSMPRTTEFRDEAFYTMNFSAREISYCILQQDPYASFAGLFAAKEAIVKAGNHYRNIPFNAIEIDHLPEGGPVHDHFRLSISHAGGFAVAVAVHESASRQNEPVISKVFPERKSRSFLWLVLLSFILSAIAIILVLRH